jgi:acyl-CoA reductase-like NAD-dependent aldehyde dehydrogenase
MTKTVKLVSPIDGSVYIEREVLSRDAAFAAAAKARDAQEAWAATPIDERIALVLRANEIIGQQTERMAEELAHQMGRPVRYGGEYGGFNERVSYMASIAEDALAPITCGGQRCLQAPDQARSTRRGAGGRAVELPLHDRDQHGRTGTHGRQHGHPQTRRPDAESGRTPGRGVRCCRAAGWRVPEPGARSRHHVGADRERAVDFVNFTGSVGGGQAMEKAAAGTFVPVSTELGGKDPGYVRADADIDKAVDTLMDGAMFNSGQCCCGIERIYVHESLHDAFVEKAVAWVNDNMKLGNPLDSETTIGPMANVRFADEVRAQVSEALADGAVAHIDTSPADDGGAYVTPQVLTNVTHDMRVMRDESFGPVVGIMPVKDDEQAIALMNDCQFGLTASIWTADAAKAEQIGDRIETGTVFMNRCDYLDPALCWTGCKDTGRGAGLSVLGIQALTRPKSYHLKKG